MRISRTAGITPVTLFASIRDHCLVLEGRIDDDNLYVSGTDHVPLSPSKVIDLPTNKNGLYADKFFADYGSGSFITDIWEPLRDGMAENHIYRIAQGGPVDVSGLNRVLASKDGNEDKATIKTMRIKITKSERWKLLYCRPKDFTSFTGLDYTTKRHSSFFPAITISWEMSKFLYDKKSGIDKILTNVNDNVDYSEFEYELIYSKVDVQDEMVFLQVQLNVAYEELL